MCKCLVVSMMCMISLHTCVCVLGRLLTEHPAAYRISLEHRDLFVRQQHVVTIHQCQQTCNAHTRNYGFAHILLLRDVFWLSGALCECYCALTGNFCDVRKPVTIQTCNQQALSHKSTKPKPQGYKPANPYERVRWEKIILIMRTF